MWINKPLLALFFIFARPSLPALNSHSSSRLNSSFDHPPTSQTRQPPTDPYDLRLWESCTSFTPGTVVSNPKIQRQKTEKGLYIAIVTTAIGMYGTETHKGYLTALRGIGCYARRHHYTHILHRDPVAEVANLRDGLYWSKVFIVARYLRYFHWLVWMDADVMVKRVDVPLEAFFAEGKDLICADAPDGNNNGVWMLRNSEWSTAFLIRWFGLRDTIDFVSDNGPWMEALLHYVLEHAGQRYHGQCVRRGGGKHVTDAGAYTRCYNTLMTRAGSPVGARQHPHIHFAYGAPHGGFNSGWGWQGRNAYQSGDFLIHFAGRGDKQEQMVNEARPEWRRGQC